jgi:hypothetical protein
MTAEECNDRACECASNAALATNVSVSLEFLKTAAQWRAMAVRDIFLGHLGAPIDALSTLNALPLLPDHSA